MISAAIILYRNLALLTNETTDDLRIGTLRVTTLINIGFLIIGILVACLTALDVITFSENGEKIFAMAFISCIMLASGILCPRIPYNRYTGLRLPWTIRDEETWKIAHNIFGAYLSSHCPAVCRLHVDSSGFWACDIWCYDTLDRDSGWYFRRILSQEIPRSSWINQSGYLTRSYNFPYLPKSRTPSSCMPRCMYLSHFDFASVSRSTGTCSRLPSA